MAHFSAEQWLSKSPENFDITQKQQHLLDLWRSYEAMLTGTEPLWAQAVTREEKAIAQAASKVADRLLKRIVAIGGEDVRERLYDYDTGSGSLPEI